MITGTEGPAAAAGWLLVALVASSRGVLVVAGHDVRTHADGELANPLPWALGVLSVVVIAGTWSAGWRGWPSRYRPSGMPAANIASSSSGLYTGAAILVVSLLIGVFILPLAAGEVPGWDSQPVVSAVTTLGVAALPVCIGVAVLKYRLYSSTASSAGWSPTR